MLVHLALVAATALVRTASLAPVRPSLSRCRQNVHASVVVSEGESTGLSKRLLELVEPTDRGVSASQDLREEIDGVIQELEGSWQGADAFAQPEYLLRRTEVAYVGQTKSVRANAAGGKYRGRMGRLLFKTDTLFQHVLSEQSVAVNVIKFKLFGLFSGSAVLPGVWRQKSGNSIAVQFQPPRLAIGPLNLRFGPTSEVTLNVTYLDENLRICRGGSSGVPFVFRADTCRDGASLEAASKSWEAVVAQKPLGKPPVVAALLVAALGCLRSALCSSAGVSRTMARVGALAFAAGAALVLRSTGGIVEDPPRARPAGDAPAAP